jgi:hypothetical protein
MDSIFGIGLGLIAIAFVSMNNKKDTKKDNKDKLDYTKQNKNEILSSKRLRDAEYPDPSVGDLSFGEGINSLTNNDIKSNMNNYIKYKKKYLKEKKIIKKNYLLKGGWDETDVDFIAYKDNIIKNMPNLGQFERKILQDLLSNINSRFSKEFTKLDEAIAFIKTLKAEELRDDLNYEFPKFSIIPKGTIFYRRQQTNLFNRVDKDIWLDYTGTVSLSQFSYLKDVNEEYTKDYLDETIKYFGEFLMEIKVEENLLILHFPSSISSYLESWVRYMCIATDNPICVDGYTLDFLKFNPNYNKSFKSLNGFRELCILKFQAQNVSLKSVISNK